MNIGHRLLQREPIPSVRLIGRRHVTVYLLIRVISIPASCVTHASHKSLYVQYVCVLVMLRYIENICSISIYRIVSLHFNLFQ